MSLLAIPIVASEDDAHEIASGTVTINAGSSTVVDSTSEWIGYRFRNVTVDQGTPLTSAYMDVTILNDGNDEPLVTIYAEDIDDAPAFAATTNNISGRTRTSASTAWSSTNLGVVTAFTIVQTPSILTAIQEVIDRPGWVSGNDIVVLIQGGANSARDLAVAFYDDGSTSKATLYLEFPDGDFARTVAASAALSGTEERTVPASAALNGTFDRDVPASAALRSTLSRTVAASAALKSTFSRTVPASASTSSAGTIRTVRASASIIVPELDGGYDLDSGMGEPDGTGLKRHWRGIREGDYVIGHLPYAGVGDASPTLRLLSRTYTTGQPYLDCDWQYISMQTEPRRPGPLGSPNPRILSDDIDGLIRQSANKTDAQGRVRQR